MISSGAKVKPGCDMSLIFSQTEFPFNRLLERVCGKAVYWSMLNCETSFSEGQSCNLEK